MLVMMVTKHMEDGAEVSLEVVDRDEDWRELKKVFFCAN